jgi:drug/metabolite transporter (DMT)-like permease
LETNNRVLAWTLLISLSLIWGSSFILIKRGLILLSPLEVGSLRILSASLALLPFALSRLKRISKDKLPYVLSVGFLGSLIPAFLFALAQTKLPSSITGVLNALTPIFTVIMGMLVFGQQHHRRVFLGIFIGFIGTAFLVSAGPEGGFTFNSYALLVVLATFFYASNLNLIKYKLQGLKSLTITSVSLVLVGPISAILLWIWTDYFDRLFVLEGMFQATLYIALLGVVGTAIALVMFNKLVQLTNPIFTSSVTYLIPIVAVSWGLFDGETLKMMHYVGMIAIVLGVYISNRPGGLKIKNQRQKKIAQ